MKFSSIIFLWIYKTLTLIFAPLGVVFICYKKRRDPPYGKRVFELLGFYKQKTDKCIWFHAASVGEVNSLKPLIKRFSETYPNYPVVLTTMTTTGELSARSIKNIITVFMPLDSSCALKRFFKRFNPSLLLIVDTELWPNMLNTAIKYNCKTLIVNGRMQEKNCKSYLKFKNIVKDLIAPPIYKVMCISPDDADRFSRIGVDPKKISVAGNIKYDLYLNQDQFKKGREIKDITKVKILCCASTHEGEESMCINAFKQMRKKNPLLKLVLVPRHKTGTILAEKYLKKMEFKSIKKSFIKNKNEYLKYDIIIGDTIGEMPFYLGLSDLVFLGGSFIPVGGHNPLEPAYFALPCITGPHYHNFKDQFLKLIDHGGAFEAENPQRLSEIALTLLKDDESLKISGIKALDILTQGKGCIDKILFEISKILK